MPRDDMSECMCVCTCARVHVCACARVRVCTCARVHACVLVCALVSDQWVKHPLWIFANPLDTHTLYTCQIT